MERSQIYGDNIETKIQGVGIFIFKNYNGLYPWKARNKKILMMQNISRRLEDDDYAGT